MIESFNRKQWKLALANGAAGLVGTVLSVWLIHWAMTRGLEFASLIGSTFGLHLFEPTTLLTNAVTIAVIVVVFATGIARWRHGIEEVGSFEFGLRPDSGNYYNQQNSMLYDVEAMKQEIHLMTQLLLFAPLRCCSAWQHLQSRVPEDASHEAQLQALRAEIAMQGKWHSVDAYPERGADVVLLSRMGEVDLNWREGRVRIES